MKQCLLCLIGLCSGFGVRAQDQLIDSLKNLIRTSDGKARAEIYWKLGSAYTRVNLDSALKYSSLAIDLGRKYKLNGPIAWGLLYSGNALGEKGFLDSCIISEKSGVALMEKLNNKESLARAYVILGNGFTLSTQDDSAIHYFLKSVELGKPYGYVEGYVGLAKIYNRTREYNTGLYYSNRAYRESSPSETETRIRSLGMTARAYLEMGRIDTAIVLTRDALILSKKNHKDVHVSNFSDFLANMYILQNDLSSAKPLANEGYNIAQRLRSKEMEGSSLATLALISFNEGDNVKALQRGLKAFDIGQQEKIPYLIYDASFVLLKAHIRLGNLKEAKFYEMQVHKARVADFQVANSKAIIDYKIKYETLQKEHENTDLKNRQITIERTVEEQRAIVTVIVMALIFTIIAGVFVIRAYQNKKRLNDLLELKNSAIMSINEEMKLRQEEIAKQKNEIEEQKEQLSQALVEREETQSLLVHSEKMASLGQLMAGIAHELNNPITFISAGTLALKDNLSEIKKRFHLSDADLVAQARDNPTSITTEERKINDDFWQENEDLIKSVLTGAERTAKIVNGLRTFSYVSPDGVQLANLIECIEATLTILQSEIKNRIEIQKDYQPIPLVECNVGEISQVFMNIIVNAVHAVNNKGSIRIRTGLAGDKLKVFVSIRDSGTGISENIIKRIFDPFFTTKPLGKGTGLGLSISYKLVEKHHGSIEVNSEPGRGSEFIVKIPVKQESP